MKSQQVCQDEPPIQSKIHHRLQHRASQVGGDPEKTEAWDLSFKIVFFFLYKYLQNFLLKIS